MAQQTISGPVASSPHAPPNTGDSAEYGDTWSVVVSKLNAMLTDCYGNIESINNGVTAFAGGGQASATIMKYGVNRVTTVATALDSVKLPVATPGARCVVINTTQLAMQVFGDSGAADLINGVANATGVTQAGPSVCTYTCGVVNLWETNDVGDGYAGNFSTVSVSPAAGVTAHAGGGQASATALLYTINRVSTVATAADSVLLPPAKHGMQLTIINDAASNSMNLFPSSQAQGGASGGDQINALGQNAAFAIAAGKTAIAASSVDGKWHIVLSA
jgi:hypothetical protein